MAEAAVANVRIWDGLYKAGRSLWYPYEVAVRLVRAHLERDGFEGILLDHGCGSGNHLEFFARLGIRAHGTEVAPGALEVVRRRFEGAKLPIPPLTLIDPERPLAGQLPYYDHLFAWGSLHYNAKQRVIGDLRVLIDRLPKGGAFLLAIPSLNDVVQRRSEPLPDGSRRIAGDLSGQAGAVVTLPAGQEQLLEWCEGITLRDAGTFGWTLGGERVEHHFVYGVAG